MSLFEELYLECTQFHVISHLRNEGYPVDILYYQAYESTEDIYKQIILDKKTRYEYKNKVRFRDFRILGIEIKSIPYTKYNEAKNDIIELLDAGIVVFIRVSEYFIPHRQLYHERHSNHSFILENYLYDSNLGLQYYSRDNKGPHFIKKLYDEETIRLAYDYCTTPNYISYLECSPNKEVNSKTIDLLKIRSADYFKHYSDNLILFEKILEIIQEHSDDLSIIIDDIESMGHAFAIISGSRYAYLQYLNKINDCQPRIQFLLMEAYKLSHKMMLVCYKALLTRKINYKRFEENCRILENIEKELKIHLCNQFKI
ncbi:hypothetical protein [Bacillus wiedmannii]|uniref:hypothetical protein n=1 Tax=Bacillus wiedmannii TaxID=1890302 RepID=UPI000BF13CAE|nr:hypothetical protein [Bacillus wiedmannii]PEL51558.1 hypothetical protein CN622_30230 [Bacillus wiedmannii]PEO05789.1 hypothetical protein CN562_29605 [Bacillus wiedmannii]PEP99147.1 hypothetical protein CN587_29735 [Bacillus wiedmannii]